MDARRLTPLEWSQRGEPALKRVFRTVNVQEEPFTDEVPRRLILDTADDYFLFQPQFQAICAAARVCGDETFLFSVVRGYLSRPEHMCYQTWELPLFEYAEYVSAEDTKFSEEQNVVVPEVIEKDIALERVLYSPTGSWGVLTPELFAVVGGSKPFIDEFKAHYPAWRKELATFLQRRLSAVRKRNVDMSWVPILLRHVYGDEAPAFKP